MTADLLEPFRAHPERAGLFTDFDGTLSHIVEVPSAARPAPGAPEALSRLGRLLAVVAVVSGRSAHELLEWLGPDIEIWGVHGAQRTRAGEVVLSDRAREVAPLMSSVRDDVAARFKDLSLEGVVIEDKGVMLGLHYRNAADPDGARVELKRIADEVAAAHGAVVAPSKMVFELRPPVEFSKSEVVLERARDLKLGAVAFAGDDVVDLPGYDALDRLRDDGVATLRVGVSAKETPPELLDRADVTVEGPDGMVAWLHAFAESLTS